MHIIDCAVQIKFCTVIDRCPHVIFSSGHQSIRKTNLEEGKCNCLRFEEQQHMHILLVYKRSLQCQAKLLMMISL